MAKKARIHICSECIKEFSSKEIYSALKPNAILPHSTVYCKKCIDELGITEYTPYLKSRVAKSNIELNEPKAEKKSKSTTEKKSKSVAKTKSTTATKTKSTTATKTKSTRKTTKK